MKQGVLILAHGSREPETQKTLEAIMDMLHDRLPETLLSHAYLQFCEKTLGAGLIELVQQGAEEITVVPYFLFSGIHIQEDIPNEIRAFTEKHPSIRVRMGKTLGADPRLADILADRVKDAL
ncbi:MAG TPA: CbiX/SirB N-terminal domain-containing protein [Firmicutes bacterium]|nr:CbiX/SirB N-terminal domain-containing protein [Bacillota bacterium]